MEGVRIQKYLADKGVGSRRKIESWISQGKVQIDGRNAVLGDRVLTQSRICISGRPLRLNKGPVKQRLLVYNKAEGEICSRSDSQKRKTVFANLPKLRGQRWVSVGRLDINTSGLLLFTNDGQLANLLMHPSSDLEREYMCRIYGDVTQNKIESLQRGLRIDGQVMGFKNIVKKNNRGQSRNNWYAVTIGEGRNREVRKLWQAVGCRVSRLIRTRYGSLTLPGRLRPGQYQEMNLKDLSKLIKSLEN